MTNIDPFIVISIVVRIFVAFGAYWTVIRRLRREREYLAEQFKRANALLIMSVTGFIITSLGTALFQACRGGFISSCSNQLALDIVSTFNSMCLLFAFMIMYSIVNLVPEKQHKKKK